jgi:hypothetical protein
MKTAMLTVCAVGLMLAIYGLADAIDRAGDTRAELAQAYREGCLPGAGETARCWIYSTASVQYAKVPRLVSAAVVEVLP